MPTGVFDKQTKASISTPARARNFFFRGLAKTLKIKESDFRKKGIGAFGKPITLTLGFGNRKLTGSTLETFEKGLFVLVKILKDKTLMNDILKTAYQGSVSKAIQRNWNTTPGLNKGGGPARKSTHTKHARLIFDLVVSDVQSKKGNTVGLPPLEKWIRNPKLNAATFRRNPKKKEDLIFKGRSSFTSGFMMLEFGTGSLAAFVRPYQSKSVTPFKVPTSLGAKPGQWISKVEIAKQMHRRLAGQSVVKGLETKARRKKQALKNAPKIPFANTPFDELAVHGIEGSLAFFDETGRLREYKRAKEQFINEVRKLLDEFIRLEVPEWRNFLTSSGGRVFASISGVF